MLGEEMEPFRLRRWRPKSSRDGIALFTCARPGRSKLDRKGRPIPEVPDALVHKWVQGLPGKRKTVIVSLLGRKPGENGKSEFSFYSFYGAWDAAEECRERISFQEWLDRWHSERFIQVVEHPTYDLCPVPPDTLNAAASDITRFLLTGRTVVLMDSGGISRTEQVCRHSGLVHDPSP